MAKKKSLTHKPGLQKTPYVQVAAFCEYVLEEKDGTISAIRTFDRIVVSKSETPHRIQINFLVMLKSGDIKGVKHINLYMTSPKGNSSDPLLAQGLFEGDEQGININGQIPIEIDGEGLYWCHVQVDNELVTRMPLRVVYSKNESEA